MKQFAKNVGQPGESHQTASKVTAGVLSINIFFAGQGHVAINLCPDSANNQINTVSSPGFHAITIVEKMDSDTFSVLKPMRFNVNQISTNDFVATFPEARISASGETPEESILMLQDMIIGRLEHLGDIDLERLGREPKRQLSVLRSYLQEC